MDASILSRYADEMLRLQDEASLAAPLTQREAPFTVADAYAVSLEAMRHREAAGWRRAGRKIGFTNRTIWDQYGVYEPMFGYMYDRTVIWADDGAIDVDGWGPEDTLSLDGLVQPLIEPEIVFRLRETPPATDDPATLLRCVDWVGHGIEVVQCHFPGWKFGVADTIADGGLHGRYVAGWGIGVDSTNADALVKQLASFKLTLFKGGNVAAKGGGDLVLGSPLNALAYLVRTLAALPGHPPLAPGELITTGTLTTAMPVAPGETWFTRVEGLPGVPGLTLRFDQQRMGSG